MIDAVEIAPGHRLIRGWLAQRRPDGAALLERLVAGLPWERREARIFGRAVPIPRLICGFGAAYGYSGQRHEATAMPLDVDLIRLTIQDETGCRFNSCLANLYRSGADSIAWHSDDERELGPEPTIASLSLGAPRRFGIRPRTARHPRGSTTFTELEHGDLLVMSGRSQSDHEHSVPKARGAERPRVNLTFRLLPGA